MFGGVDIRSYTQESLRQMFGVVAQDTSLFNRTLGYNIGYGKIEASDGEIKSALRAAQLKKFYKKLPKKLKTVVGERGIRLVLKQASFILTLSCAIFLTRIFFLSVGRRKATCWGCQVPDPFPGLCDSR